MTAKDTARRIVDTLPDEASMDDIMHALYVVAKFQHGQREIEEGKGIPHEEARRRLQKWGRPCGTR